MAKATLSVFIESEMLIAELTEDEFIFLRAFKDFAEEHGVSVDNVIMDNETGEMSVQQ